MVYTFSLKNKVIIITGGYGHLGKAITESLLYHEAIVYVLGRDEAKFNASFSNSSINTSNLHFVYADISQTDTIVSSFRTIFEKEGKIDVLINNAFYSRGQSPELMSDDDWAYCIDGTLSSVFRTIRSIIPFFKDRNSGKIINVSSMYGVIAPQFEIYDDYPAYLNPPHYGAAKAGVIQLTKYYASYLGKFNIQVNTVTPGPFPSDTIQEVTGFVDELKAKTSLNRIGKPEDLAGAFVFLSSDTSNFITGQNIVVDGGWISK